MKFTMHLFTRFFVIAAIALFSTLMYSVDSKAQSVSITSVDVLNESCAGLSDGQITINKAGGTGPFGFYIVFFNGTSLDTITQISNVFPNLAATNYDTYVVDSNDLTKDSVTSVNVIQGNNFIFLAFSNHSSNLNTSIEINNIDHSGIKVGAVCEFRDQAKELHENGVDFIYNAREQVGKEFAKEFLLNHS